MLVNNRWYNPKHVKERVCTQVVELWAMSSCPCCVLREFPLLPADAVCTPQLSFCQARKSTPHFIHGDLRRFQPHIPLLHFNFLIVSADFYVIIFSIYL